MSTYSDKLVSSIFLLSLGCCSFVEATPSERQMKKVERLMRSTSRRLDKIEKITKEVCSLCSNHNNKLSNTEERKLEQQIRKAILDSSIIGDSMFDPGLRMHTKFPLVGSEEYLRDRIASCTEKEKKLSSSMEKLANDKKPTKSKQSEKEHKKLEKVLSKLKALNLRIQKLVKTLRDAMDIIIILPSYAAEKTSRELYI